MLTSIPPVMMALKLTIFSMEMTLYSTVSFPYFFKPPTNLMTSNTSPALAFEKLFNIKVLPALNTNIYFSFDFWFLFNSLPAWLYSAKAIRIIKRNEGKTEMFLF